MQLNVVWDKNKKWVEDLDTMFVIFVFQLFNFTSSEGLLKIQQPSSDDEISVDVISEILSFQFYLIFSPARCEVAKNLCLLDQPVLESDMYKRRSIFLLISC